MIEMIENDNESEEDDNIKIKICQGNHIFLDIGIKTLSALQYYSGHPTLLHLGGCVIVISGVRMTDG